MRKSDYLIVLATAAFTVSSCNTFIGVGRDMQSLGIGIQNTGHGKTWDGKQKLAPGTSAVQPIEAPEPIRRFTQ